jgi:hypothetical protein
LGWNNIFCNNVGRKTLLMIFGSKQKLVLIDSNNPVIPIAHPC